VEFDKCDFLLRIRSLERNGVDERYGVDGTPQGNCPVYVDVHGSRRQQDPIGDRNRQRSSAHRLCCADRRDQCGSEHRPERWQHDAHLDLDRRNGMHGLRGLERNRAGKRHAKHGRALGGCDLHANLHRSRRQCDTVGDRQRQFNSAADRLILFRDEWTAHTEGERGSRFWHFSLSDVLRRHRHDR